MGDGQTSRWYRKLRKDFRASCQQAAAPCWLCGQPIDYTIPWKDPLTGEVNDEAFELDHLLPRSTHPELAEDPGNFRPTHRSCNRQKSNRILSGGLGRVSRKWFS